MKEITIRNGALLKYVDLKKQFFTFHSILEPNGKYSPEFIKGEHIMFDKIFKSVNLQIEDRIKLSGDFAELINKLIETETYKDEYKGILQLLQDSYQKEIAILYNLAKINNELAQLQIDSVLKIQNQLNEILKDKIN